MVAHPHHQSQFKRLFAYLRAHIFSSFHHHHHLPRRDVVGRIRRVYVQSISIFVLRVHPLYVCFISSHLSSFLSSYFKIKYKSLFLSFRGEPPLDPAQLLIALRGGHHDDDFFLLLSFFPLSFSLFILLYFHSTI